MASQIELLVEAEKRGLLTPDKQQLLDEARTRGLVPATQTPQEIAAAAQGTLTPHPEGLGGIPRLQNSTQPSAFGDNLAPALMGNIQDFVTGDNRREFEFPELPNIFLGERRGVEDRQASGETLGDILQTPGTSSGSALTLSAGRDDLRKLDILRTQSGIDFDANMDQFGNVFVTINDEQAQQLSERQPGSGEVQPGNYYLNRPGASQQDVFDVGAEGAFDVLGAVAGGRGAAKVLPGSRIAQAGGVGLGSAAGAVGQDLAAGQLGSTRGVDPVAAIVAGVFGLGSEALGQVVGRFLIDNSDRLIQNGQLTEQGRSALTSAGLPESQLDFVTPEFIETLRRASRDASTPAEQQQAAIVAEGASLPEPVRFTQGDISRDVGQQGVEENLLKQAAGTPGDQNAIQAFRQGQQGALRINADLIQQRLGGGSGGVVDPGDGIAQVQRELADQAGALKSQVDDAYEQARVLSRESPETAFEQDSVKQLSAGINQRIALDFGSALEPNGPATRLLTELQTITGLSRPNAAFNSPATVNAMESWLQRVNAAIRGNAGSPEGAALTRAKALYLEYRDGAIEQGLIEGNEEAVAAWQRASSLRRELAEKFETDNLLSSLIQEVPDGSGGLTLALPASEALNKLFTASTAGGKPGATNALTRIKALLGEDSQAWGALKEEAWVRLLRSQNRGNNRDADLRQLFSGDKFSTALDAALEKSPEVMNILFDEADMALIEQFRRVALRATNRVPGVVNNSNSFNALGRLANRMSSRNMLFRNGAAAFGELFRFIRITNLAQNAAAGRAINPRPLSVSGPGTNALSGVGAAVGPGAVEAVTGENPEAQVPAAINDIRRRFPGLFG